MKRVLIIVFFSIVGSKCFANVIVKSDTTIVEFTDKKAQKRITVTTPDDNKFEIPINLNLENLLKEMGIDSSQRNRAIYLIGKNEGVQDTILVISQSGQRISIVANEKLKNTVKNNSKDEDRFSHSDSDESFDFDANDDDDDESYESSSTNHEANKRFFSKSDFGFYLGLNNFQDKPNDEANLRAWRSRYIALSFRKHLTLVNGKNTDFALSYAPEFAWYNFMFENNNGAIYPPGGANRQVDFTDLQYNTEKSKLVVPHLNLPIMLHLGFKQAKFKVGVGGYVGYRVGGYTKVKDSNGDKEKVKGSFGLEDFQYGLTAEVGKRRGFTVFFRYALKDLFKSNQINASDLRPFSVGLRI